MALQPPQYNTFGNSGRYLYGGSSNPSAVIDRRISNSVIATYRYPPDLPKYQFYIVEFEPTRTIVPQANVSSVSEFLDSISNIVDPELRRAVSDAISGLGRDLTWSNFVNNITPELFSRIADIIGRLNAQKTYVLPLPTPPADVFSVRYNQDYGYLDKAAGAATGGVTAAAGITVNTFKTVTLESPQYRRFSFKWKFSPKTFEESQDIQRICYNIRKGMTPKINNSNKLILYFPKIYGLYFHPNAKFLYKFKPCVITDMAVDYSGGNEFPGFYRATGGPENSPPESVAVELKFMELEYWLDSLDGSDVTSDYKFDSDGLPTNDVFDAWNFYKPNI